MANLMAVVDLKCRIIGVDDIHPRKEKSQHFENYNLKTQSIDTDEWEMRMFFAYMLLKYGMDMEDWEWDEWEMDDDDDD